MTTEEVREILRMSQLPISLEKPIGEEEDSELGLSLIHISEPTRPY